MIYIGPAGTSALGYPNALIKCKDLQLACNEVSFTYGVRITNTQAKVIGDFAKKLGISLSIHAPYWINLNSAEEIKITQSKQRILDSCERGHHMGAKYIVFHAAFYQKSTQEQTYSAVKSAIIEMNQIIKKNKWDVVLAPETTGKKSQFGDLDELLKLRDEAKCELCVDFSHLKARDQKIDYNIVFKKLRPLKHIHSHFSGIEYGDKGERRHILTPHKELKELLSFMKKSEKDFTLINESPDSFGDSVKALKILANMK